MKDHQISDNYEPTNDAAEATEAYNHAKKFADWLESIGYAKIRCDVDAFFAFCLLICR